MVGSDKTMPLGETEEDAHIFFEYEKVFWSDLIHVVKYASRKMIICYAYKATNKGKRTPDDTGSRPLTPGPALLLY